MNNLNKIVLTSVLTLSSAFSNASIITFGDLSTDVAYDIIADTERGREYLRFDKLSTTYAETITSISSGGIYEGWSVANSDISDDFINALFGQNGENLCSTHADYNGELCGDVLGWTDNSFGASYNVHNDYYAIESTDGVGNFGIVELKNSGDVREYNNWANLATIESEGIRFLLYRENSLHLNGFNVNAAANNLVSNASVPTPATMGMLAIAMAGLSFRRKSA